MSRIAQAQGGGIQLAYSPEVSVLMFSTVEGASRTCSALLSGLPELNGSALTDRIRSV